MGRAGRQAPEVAFDDSPARQGHEQARHGGPEDGLAITELRDLADRLIDERVEAGDPLDEAATQGRPVRHTITGVLEEVGEVVADLPAETIERRGQLPRRPAEVRQAHDQRGADDAERDLAGPRDREHEDLIGRRDRVARDDGQGIARQHGRIGGEVAHQRPREGAARGPERHADQEAGAVLRKHTGEDDRHRGADHGADQAEEPLAQRGPEDRLAHDGGRGPGPGGVFELEEKGHEERQTDRRGQADAVEQRRHQRCTPGWRGVVGARRGCGVRHRARVLTPSRSRESGGPSSV